LLQRLNVVGDWDKEDDFTKWELQNLNPPLLSPVMDLADTAVPKLGWTYRLNSGNLKFEKDMQARFKARSKALTLLLNELDVLAVTQPHNFSSNTLLFYEQNGLAKDRKLFDVRDVASALVQKHLSNMAEASLSKCSWSVREKSNSSCALSNDCADY
jgi:hypothetical protein